MIGVPFEGRSCGPHPWLKLYKHNPIHLYDLSWSKRYQNEWHSSGQTHFTVPESSKRGNLFCRTDHLTSGSSPCTPPIVTDRNGGLTSAAFALASSPPPPRSLLPLFPAPTRTPVDTFLHILVELLPTVEFRPFSAREENESLLLRRCWGDARLLRNRWHSVQFMKKNGRGRGTGGRVRVRQQKKQQRQEYDQYIGNDGWCLDSAEDGTGNAERHTYGEHLSMTSFRSPYAHFSSPYACCPPPRCPSPPFPLGRGIQVHTGKYANSHQLKLSYSFSHFRIIFTD